VNTISVCILTFNDADVIGDAISSVRWADEVVVVDTGSADGTVGLAQSMGARVISVPFTGFGDLRNRAAGEARMDWVFSLDADERCTPDVRDEMLSILKDGRSTCDAYLIARRNYFMGRWLKGGGFYPDYRAPQLFRRGMLRYTLEPIHEGYELLTARAPGKLAHPIWHLPFRNLEEILFKANRFSTLGAQRIKSERVTMWTALGHGVWAFLRLYVFRLGFRDGWAGFVLALANFEGTFYRYAKRHEQLQDWPAVTQGPLMRNE
jgi:glycosyltransferase involved in cell wall biosynthesis